MRKISRFERLSLIGLFFVSATALLFVSHHFLFRVGDELSPPRLVIYGYVPLAVGLISLLMLLAGHRLRLLVAIYGAAIGISLLLAEAYLQLHPSEDGHIANNNPAEVKSLPGLPHLCASHFLDRSLFDGVGQRLFPLTGIANNLIKRDISDDGTILHRSSDQHGFDNPPNAWRKNAVEVLIVGDSFAFGSGVRIGEGFSDRLRARFHVVNLACGGNGPLIELATLREYGSHLAPPVVLWAYYEGNDLSKNLVKEMADPFLSQYLDPDFSQNLINRQPEIDSILRSYLTKRGQAPSQPQALTEPEINLKHLFMLNTIVGALGLSNDFDNRYLNAFSDMIEDAASLVRSWGGELVFVYLPSEHRYTNAVANYVAKGYADQVLHTVSESGVNRIVDIGTVFDAVSRPRALFRGHYTPEGYDLVAQSISRELDKIKVNR